MPSVAIGGISLANCADTIACGVSGVCTISALLGPEDTRAAAEGFRAALAGKA
jgi:thiamine monophosphate synthase